MACFLTGNKVEAPTINKSLCLFEHVLGAVAINITAHDSCQQVDYVGHRMISYTSNSARLFYEKNKSSRNAIKSAHNLRAV